MDVDHPIRMILIRFAGRGRYRPCRNYGSRNGNRSKSRSRRRQFTNLRRRRRSRNDSRGQCGIGLRHQRCRCGGQWHEWCVRFGDIMRAAGHRGDPQTKADHHSDFHEGPPPSARQLPCGRSRPERPDNVPVSSLWSPALLWLRRRQARLATISPGCAPQARVRAKLRNRQGCARPRRHRGRAD
jgi:hypothetical protein